MNMLIVLVQLMVALAAVPQYFVNENLQNTLDLSAPYLRQTVKVKARNIIDEPVISYEIPIEASQLYNLASIEAESAKGEHLEVAIDTESIDSDFAYFSVYFPQGVAPGAIVEFTYKIALLHVLEPLPAAATQNDQQLILFDGSRTVLSAYATESQVTTVQSVTQQLRDLETGQEVHATAEKDVGGLLTFGPFKNVEALNTKSLKLQYENPLPQIRFKNLERKVWISHWGDAVSFDESYDMYNAGTQLSEPFSRLGYMQPQSRSYSLNHAAIKQLRFNLPPKSREAYYVDLVGNVSTSRILRTGGKDTLEIVPRYPVMGGWQYNFTIGWANSLGAFVRELASDRYIAAIPIVFGPADVSYDKVSTQIILPEGATDIEVLDATFQTVDEQYVFSYLDTQGRPAITFEYHNVIDQHVDSQIVVAYSYTTTSAFRKPVTYVGYFLALFAAVYVFNGLDFSL